DDFRNRTFFGGRNVHFQFYSSPENVRRSNFQRVHQTIDDEQQFLRSKTAPVVQKPNFAVRMMGKAIGKMSKYALKKGFGIDLDLPARGNDIHKDLKISSNEATSGCRKQVRYKRGKEKKTLEVTIPAGIISGKKIKLSGMGEEGVESGDLYLRIDVR
ncbi:MAG: hypothetical protein GY852_03660, partial [bacterium]|nr:hypothetical protein [bacterium]